MRPSRLSRETAEVSDAVSNARQRFSARRAAQASTNGKLTSDHESDRKPDPETNGSDAALSLPVSILASAKSSQPNAKKRRRTNVHEVATFEPVPSSDRPSRKSSRTDSPTANTGQVRQRTVKRITGLTGSLNAGGSPHDWERIYSITAAMRKRVLAPVDTMGCESLAEEDKDPKAKRLQTLVALMLSSQTKDTVTAAAMRNLQANLSGGFTLDALLTVEPNALNKLIEKVGFHNNKTMFIKKVAEILHNRFDGDIPDTIEGLISLPGVGPKMAFLCMSSAWGRDEGIGVDVHVHRITNLWGWHKTLTPEQTRIELESWLPKDKWHDINHLLVGFGQTICLPVGRRCGECDLAPTGLCPSAVPSDSRRKAAKKQVSFKAKIELDDQDVPVKADAMKVEIGGIGSKVEASP